MNQEMQTSLLPQRPVTILIAALGGEGGGLFADWLVAAAMDCDYPVQSTSIPGVSQRTGATTYYVEIYPATAAQLNGRTPVMALTPTPGAIDVVAASELIEAGRALQGGYIDADNTTLVASTHRIYAVAEKVMPGDGRADSEKVLAAVRAYVREACDVAALKARLGRDWSTLRVAFKPYPVCAFNQTLVGAALALKERIGSTPIKRATVRMNPFETGYAGMDSKGPFTTISGTLMSIPFCTAAPLLRGLPTMSLMTTYDDAAVNALTERITLESDASVATLSCKIAVELENGTTIEEYARKTPADYGYSRADVSALIRRIGREEGVPMAAYDRIEGFVEALPDGKIDDAIGAFALIARRAAA